MEVLEVIAQLPISAVRAIEITCWDRTFVMLPISTRSALAATSSKRSPSLPKCALFLEHPPF